MFFLKIFVLLLVSGGMSFAEVARPSNLKVTEAEAGTPAECAAFFHEAGWEGLWDNQRPHELWIENIRKDCTAQVVYAFGARPGKNDSPSYFRITNAEIKGSTMSFSLPSKTAKISVTYTLSNETLSGTWQSDQSTYPPSTVSLAKRK